MPAEDACTGTSCSSTTRLMNLQRCNLELLMVDVSHSSDVLCQISFCHVNSKEWKLTVKNESKSLLLKDPPNFCISNLCAPCSAKDYKCSSVLCLCLPVASWQACTLPDCPQLSPCLRPDLTASWLIIGLRLAPRLSRPQLLLANPDRHDCQLESRCYAARATVPTVNSSFKLR